jgi:hypothetical protein
MARSRLRQKSIVRGRSRSVERSGAGGGQQGNIMRAASVTSARKFDTDASTTNIMPQREPQYELEQKGEQQIGGERITQLRSRSDAILERWGLQTLSPAPTPRQRQVATIASQATLLHADADADADAYTESPDAFASMRSHMETELPMERGEEEEECINSLQIETSRPRLAVGTGNMDIFCCAILVIVVCMFALYIL